MRDLIAIEYWVTGEHVSEGPLVYARFTNQQDAIDYCRKEQERQENNPEISDIGVEKRAIRRWYND